MPPGADPLIGRTLGDFVVQERIGAGGFGVVYAAQQPILERSAVIKVLTPDRRGHSETTGRFLREARLASQLDHPFAAHVYAFGAEQDGLLWIAMERVRGTPLDKMLAAQGPMPARKLVPLVDRLSEVVHTAHEQGIIHRDIKPANVMVLSRAGLLVPKLLDLGIARFASDQDREIPTGATSSEPKEVASKEGSFEAATLDAAMEASLTRQGDVVGSPRYMAPEQWIDASHADARTDVYALGVLSYEALVGRPPFDGNSLRQIARAHASQPVPPLPSPGSDALHVVLAKAMAKRPQDRFATALDFATALRTAAGMGDDAQALPRLDDQLRETLIAEAPQPLAEAVALLDAARTPTQALDALQGVSSVASRLLGAIALAAYSRVGAEGSQKREIETLLARMRESGLSNGEWRALARELARPFAWKADAYPVPELVSLFWRTSRGELESQDPLSALDESLRVQTDASKADVAALHVPLAAASTGLASLGFLLEYRLIARAQGSVVSWSGMRRAQRVTHRELGELGEGDVGLAGRDGELVLRLSPFVQAMAPAPGTPLDLFFLEGPGRFGAKLVAHPMGFERHDDSLWSWFTEHGLAVGAEGAAVFEERAPYRGLSSFTAEDSEHFYGREREAESFVNRLRVAALLAVVGPSGSGKSSFVQAGVIPSLPASIPLVVRPGANPVRALWDRLDVEQQASARPWSPPALRERLLEIAGARKAPVFLVVDQFEELVTLCHDPRAREEYASALAAAAVTPEEPIRIVLTLRDDFLIRIQQLTAFRDRLGSALQLLGTPAPQDLMRILTEPARRAGYAFEDPRLPEEMIAAVTDEPGALALLSFTATKLWEVRDRRLKRIPKKAYEAIGGVGGALAHHAESCLAELDDGGRKLVREAFRQLVTSAGTRATMSRGDMLEVLGKSAAAEHVLEHLIQARLLVASEGAGPGQDRIEVIHEALLVSWPRLVQWQREDAEGARMRDQLRAAAKQWDQRGRLKGILWRGEALVEYRVWRARYTGALTAVEETFAAASLKEEARGAGIRRRLVLTAFFVLAAGSVVLFNANGRARASAREASARMVDLLVEQGRQEMLAGHPLGLAYLAQAASNGADSPGIRYLVGRAMAEVRTPRRVLEGHQGPVRSVEYSPDGQRLVTGGDDRTARLWAAATGSLELTLSGHTDSVTAAHFSRDGRRLVTVSAMGMGIQPSKDHSARVWSIPEGKLLFEASDSAQVADARFNANGSLLATVSDDGNLALWDTATGRRRSVIALPSHALCVVRFSPDGTQVAAADADGVTRVWNTADDHLLSTLEGHRAHVMDMSYSPDGRWLLTASMDTTVRVWNPVTGQAVSVFGEHTDVVGRATFSPDGKWVASGTVDGPIRIWAPSTGLLVMTLDATGGKDFDFSPDGTLLASTSGDNVAQLWRLSVGRAPWDSKRGKLLETFHGHSGLVSAVAFAPDSRSFATASMDGTAIQWEAKSQRQLGVLPQPNFVLWSAFDASGGRVVTYDVTRNVAVFDAHTGALLKRFPLDEGQPSNFAFDKHDLFAAGFSTETLVYDLRSGKKVAQLPSATDLDFAGDSLLEFDHSARLVRAWATDGFSPRGETPLPCLPVAVSADRDGRRLAISCEDAPIHIVERRDGNTLATLEGRTQAAGVSFSVDGARLLTRGVQTADVWDAHTGKHVSTLRGHAARLSTAHFDPTGDFVLTVSWDRTARVWEASSGKVLDILDPNAGGLGSGSYAPDGDRALLTGGTEPMFWDERPFRDPLDEFERFVDCHVPYHLGGDHLVAGPRQACTN